MKAIQLKMASVLPFFAALISCGDDKDPGTVLLPDRPAAVTRLEVMIDGEPWMGDLESSANSIRWINDEIVSIDVYNAAADEVFELDVLESDQVGEYNIGGTTNPINYRCLDDRGFNTCWFGGDSGQIRIISNDGVTLRGTFSAEMQDVDGMGGLIRFPASGNFTLSRE